MKITSPGVITLLSHESVDFKFDFNTSDLLFHFYSGHDGSESLDILPNSKD